MVVDLNIKKFVYENDLWKVKSAPQQEQFQVVMQTEFVLAA